MSNFCGLKRKFWVYVTHEDRWRLAVKGKKIDSKSRKIYTVDSDNFPERRGTL
jgi:hypothetical protein